MEDKKENTATPLHPEEEITAGNQILVRHEANIASISSDGGSARSDTSKDDVLLEYLIFPIRIIQRKFSSGSVKGSVITLLNAIIGAGFLALPGALAQSGIIWGLMQLLFCAYLGYLTNVLLVKTANKTKKYSYMAIARHFWGTKVEFVVKVLYFISLWGINAVSMILANNLFGKTCETLFGNSAPSWLTSSHGYFWPPVFTTIILLPLSIPREVASLRYFYLIGLIFVLYLPVVMIIEALRPSIDSFSNNAKIVFSPDQLFKIAGTTVMLPSSIFNYVCQINTLYVYKELQRPSLRRMKKVIRRTMSTIFILYAIITVFGFITFANDMEALIDEGNVLLNNYKGHVTITIAYILVNMQNIFSMPLVTVPCKDCLDDMIFPTDSDVPSSQREGSQVKHVILIIIVTYSQMAAAMFIPKISTAVTFFGSTITPTITYLLPCLFYLRTLKPGRKMEKIGVLVFVAGIVVFLVYQIIGIVMGNLSG